jgi:hypothetical protein
MELLRKAIAPSTVLPCRDGSDPSWHVDISFSIFERQSLRDVNHVNSNDTLLSAVDYTVTNLHKYLSAFANDYFCNVNLLEWTRIPMLYKHALNRLHDDGQTYLSPPCPARFAMRPFSK